MKDIDFDELDRAVTSALGTSQDSSVVDQAEPSSEQESVPSSDADTHALDVASPSSRSISAHNVHSRIMPSGSPTRTTLARKSAMPETASSDDSSDSVEVTQAPESAPRAKRTIPHREGRFMDVVRPGQKAMAHPVPTPAPSGLETSESSARQDYPDTAPPEPSGEHNASLEAAINELFVSEGHEPVAVPAETAEPKTEAPVALPEPDTPMPEAVTQDISSEEQAAEDIAAELAQPVELAPTESPFLPDAKVDKRPLGGVELPDAMSEEETTPVDTLDLAPAADDAPGAPMPAELASDLTAIEAQEASTTTVPTAEEVSAPSETSAPSVAAATGPTSIARQYKEQPRTASEDDEAGAIFDPGTYQAPVEHPAKKSSGWGWVIACVLIIVLATVAGVVAWMEGVLPVPL